MPESASQQIDERIADLGDWRGAVLQRMRDLIHQVLFTNPGERVNRPDFGCGLKNLVFMPNSEPLVAATQLLVKGALQNWLRAEILVEQVTVEVRDEQLVVSVTYTKRETGERRLDQFIGAV